MTPALFWSAALAVLALVLVVALGRRLLRALPDGGSQTLPERLAAWRDRLTGSRPVDLATWPETLAGQALRAARPVPGGRLMASSFQVRCGRGLYAVAAPRTVRLESAFVAVLEDCAAPGDLPDHVRIRFTYDESLAREAYRLDMEFAHGSPFESPTSTVLHVPSTRPSSDPLPAAEPVVEVALSWWSIIGPDGAAVRVPLEGTVTVGADATCDIVVTEPHVSGCHLRVGVSDDRLELRDGSIVDDGDGRSHVRPSLNGTFLRDHPISRAGIAPGGEPIGVRLGPHAQLWVEYGDPAATYPMLSAVVELHPAGEQR